MIHRVLSKKRKVYLPKENNNMIHRVLSKKRKVDLPKDLKKLIEAHASTKDLKRVETTRRKSVVAKTFNKVQN